jgi:MFS family permease
VLVGVTGWVADRFDRRKLLMITQSSLLILGLAIGALIFSGVMTLPIMYLFALALGTVAAFDNPARQAFVSDLVTRENASNAVALNAASFNGARMIGPAVAGLVIVAVGTGWVFVVNAVTFIGMLAALVLIRTDELIPRVKATGSARLADGFRYVAKRPDLIVTFAMVFLVGAFGMNFPIYASTMAIEFGQEADGFGLLSSILAIGSLTGALLAARRDKARIRVVIGGTLLFAVAAGVSAFMPTYWTYAATLMFTGFAVVTMLTTAKRVRPDDHRSRSARPRARALHGDPHGRHADRGSDRRLGRVNIRAPGRDSGRRHRGRRRLRHRCDSGCCPPAACTVMRRSDSVSRSTRRARCPSCDQSRRSSPSRSRRRRRSGCPPRRTASALARADRGSGSGRELDDARPWSSASTVTVAVPGAVGRTSARRATVVGCGHRGPHAASIAGLSSRTAGSPVHGGAGRA